MGPLRPARPKRKKAAALTAPNMGSTTTNALPIVLLLLLLPTGAKCAQRTQTTCGHTSPHTPRSGVVKRFLASKTFTEKLHANHTANEPATLPASSEPAKAFTDRSHAHYYGNFTHRLRQQNDSRAPSTHSFRKQCVYPHNDSSSHKSSTTPYRHSANNCSLSIAFSLYTNYAGVPYQPRDSFPERFQKSAARTSQETLLAHNPATNLPLQRQKENDKKETRTNDHMADRLGAANECRMPRTATGRPRTVNRRSAQLGGCSFDPL